MDFTTTINQIKSQRLAGVRYEQEGRHRFKDSLTICINGTLIFERFCYGEAASKVCTLHGKVASNGQIVWDYDACQYPSKQEAPQTLTSISDNLLYFDEKSLGWAPGPQLKTVPSAGLGALKMLFSK